MALHNTLLVLTSLSLQAKVAKIGTDVLATRYETRYIYGPIASTICKFFLLFTVLFSLIVSYKY